MITLTSAFAFTVGGIAQETDASAALVNYSVNWQSNLLTCELAFGSFAGGVFTQGTRVNGVQITLNLSTGTWTSSNGFSGTLSGPALAGVNANFKSDRNTIEAFCVANNIAPGVQTPW